MVCRVKNNNQANYKSLDNTEKKLKREKGFFVLPEKLRGEINISERKFLVFYFSSNEDYELIKNRFESKTKGREHPIMDEKLLINLVKDEQRI